MAPRRAVPKQARACSGDANQPRYVGGVHVEFENPGVGRAVDALVGGS